MRAFAVLALAALACTETNVVEDPSADGAFPVTHTPFTIPKEGIALVTDNGSDQISVIDLGKNQVVAQPIVAVDPIAVNGPHELAVDEKGGFVYSLLTFPPPTVAPGPHGSHGLSSVPGVLLKLSLSDLSRVAELTVDVNPGDVAVTPDGTKVLVSHFDIAKAVAAEVKGLPVEDMRATLMVVDANTMQPIVDITVCVAPHEIDVSDDGKTVYLACYGEDAVGIVHLDDPQLVSNPAHAVERIPVTPSPGPPANPAAGPYSISVVAGQALVADQVSKTFDVIDLTSRKLVRSVGFPGTPFAPGASTAPGQWLMPTQSPDSITVVDMTAGTTVTSNPVSDCVKPHQVVGIGNRYFVTCEGDHKIPSVVLEIDPVTLATVRKFDVGVYPDIIEIVGGGQ